jgi:pimeloyl-ACP methyl ester carboxylesterase
MGKDISTRGPAERLAATGKFDVVRFRYRLAVFSPEELAYRRSLSGDESRAFVRRGAQAIRSRLGDDQRVRDSLSKERDYHSVGIAGASVGGIFAVLLGGLEPERVAGVLVLLSGVDIADIRLSSGEGDIRRVRERVFELCPISRDEARSILTEELRDVEPLDVASRIDAQKLLIVSNVFDSVIPSRDTEKLWRATHEPKWDRNIFPPGPTFRRCCCCRCPCHSSSLGGRDSVAKLTTAARIDCGARDAGTFPEDVRLGRSVQVPPCQRNMCSVCVGRYAPGLKWVS